MKVERGRVGEGRRGEGGWERDKVEDTSLHLASHPAQRTHTCL